MKSDDPYAIIKFPISTEKAIRMMEAENKIVMMVDPRATKQQIKTAAETILKAKIVDINTQITPKGTKKAYLKFAPDVLAMDIATNLGIL